VIGKLKGLVDSIEKDYVIIDVAGVGYKVLCSTKTLETLIRDMGQKVELFIETLVREDQISLLGFCTKTEQDCFSKLTTVQGVGAKLALIILGALSPDKIAVALASQDTKAFSGISGVGPKLTSRIFTELKDKDMNFATEFVSSTNRSDSGVKNTTQEDAISALVNLGINKSDAYVIVNKILVTTPDVKIGDLIKLALKQLSK
jgi:Holliday junction DNA helicase RuvA